MDAANPTQGSDRSILPEATLFSAYLPIFMTSRTVNHSKVQRYDRDFGQPF